MKFDETTYKFLDLFLKGFFGVLVTAAIAYYSISSQTYRDEMTRQANQRTAMVDFISKQKDQDIDQRMRMFECLMSHYLQKDIASQSPGSVKERLMLMRLMALNFQDIPINLKPLYQQLDEQLTDNRDKKRLREIGKEVARRQADRLIASNGQDFEIKSAKAGGLIAVPNLALKISVSKVAPDYIVASFIYGEKTLGPIRVTYFDMPLVDNTKIGGLRMSLLLQGVDEQAKTAKVRLIAFENYLAMDRFDVKDMTIPLAGVWPQPASNQ